MNPTTRRIGARIVLSLGLCLALQGAGLAAKKPRCGGVQRRAQSKLESSLTACAEKGVSAAIASCSTEKWEKYTRQLRRSRCPVGAGVRHFGNPALSKVRAEGVSADDLAAADVAVRDAHLALRALLTRLAAAVRGGHTSRPSESALVRFANDLSAAIERLSTAEQQLEDVEAALWGGLRGDPLLPWLIDEPLRVAMEQVQVETRRLLGPDFRTEIEALRDEPACAGDLIGDRLIAEYGRAVLTPGEDRTPEVAALGRVAAQLACISFRQASLLDVALGVAYDMVATRLERAGLDRVEDAFARYFAPLEVLVFDTVKIGGDHALAWHWFKDHRAALRDEVSRLGWATDDVLWLYDRLDGKLVGYPQCGADPRRCVDVPAFLDSLVDPRALGLGNCAFAGMVAGGLKQAGGASLYACPSADCAAGASAPSTGTIGSRTGIGSGSFGTGSFGGLFGSGGGSGGGGSASDALPWSGLSAADRGVISELGCGGIGGGGAGGSGDDGGTQGRGGHGGAGDTEDCVEQAITAPRDPFGAFVQCAAAATDSGPGATLDLRGVPTGPECSPGVAEDKGKSGGGSGGATSTTTPPSSASTTTVAASDTTSTTVPPPCIPTGLLDAIQKSFDCGLKVIGMALSPEKNKAATKATSGVAAAAGEVVGAELELLKPENAENFYGAIGSNLQNQIALECTEPGSGHLSAEECSTLAGMKPGDAADYLRKTGHMKDCAPDQECDAVCTSFDEQVKQRLDDCRRKLEDSLVGEGPKQNDPSTRINPDPDGDAGHGLPDDPLTSCLLASAPGDAGGTNFACGVVLCTDGPSTAKASSACCGQAAPAIGVSVGRVLLEHTCEAVHCADDQAAVADGLGACGCGSAGGGIGGGTPSPGPGPSPER